MYTRIVSYSVSAIESLYSLGSSKAPITMPSAVKGVVL